MSLLLGKWGSTKEMEKSWNRPVRGVSYSQMSLSLVRGRGHKRVGIRFKSDYYLVKICLKQSSVSKWSFLFFFSLCFFILFYLFVFIFFLLPFFLLFSFVLFFLLLLFLFRSFILITFFAFSLFFFFIILFCFRIPCTFLKSVFLEGK